MKTIIVKIPVDFVQFLKMADEILKDPMYKNEDRIAVAKHQSVIKQEEAFEKALGLIKGLDSVNVAVEPTELVNQGLTVIYDAKFTIVELENRLVAMKQLYHHIQENNTYHWVMETE